MIRALLEAVAALVLLLAPAAARACTAAATQTATAGPFSPNAIKLGVEPYTSNVGGFSCTSGNILTLLSGNYLKATSSSANSFILTSTGTGSSFTYSLAADAAGTNVLTPGTPTYYINGSTVNLLGTLGTSTINVPIYIKPTSTTAVAAGTYTGQFSLLWQWSFCSSVNALNVCIGTVDSGSKTTAISLTVTVQAAAPTVTISSALTWDPIDQTTNPKSIPGAKQRITVTVANPDIAPVDSNVLLIVAPSPANAIPALDGDGTSGSTPFTFTEGATPSTLKLVYTSPSSTSDDVDFSTDGGTTWTYAPVAGSASSESVITQIRLRPEGTMAAGSSFSVTIPYQVK